MVDGLKFGVDFLAYDKDPTRFHAEYMVLVTRQGQGTQLSAIDLVAIVNVAAKANKTLLAAHVSSSNTTVSFYALRRRPVVYARKGDQKRVARSVLAEEELLEQVAG